MVSGQRLRGAAVVALVLGLGLPALAQPGDIKGQDALGDKSRSANDGWSQAPVPREESAAKDAPNPGGNSQSNKPGAPGSKDNNANASEMNNGSDDPQKPLDHRTPNPSGNNPASPTK